MAGGSKMCTSFAVYGQKKTVYGMTFDTDEIDLKLKVNSYNDMNYFFFAGFAGDGFADIAGFNSEGLFVCTQAVEYGPEFKAGCDENDWYAFSIFGDVIKKTGKTPEKEIEKAESIRLRYFELKNKRNEK